MSDAPQPPQEGASRPRRLVLVLSAAWVAVLLFLLFVWPTAWRADGEGKGPRYRTHRLTGKTQVYDRRKEEWRDARGGRRNARATSGDGSPVGGGPSEGGSEGGSGGGSGRGGGEAWWWSGREERRAGGGEGDAWWWRGGEKRGGEARRSGSPIGGGGRNGGGNRGGGDLEGGTRGGGDAGVGSPVGGGRRSGGSAVSSREEASEEERSEEAAPSPGPAQETEEDPFWRD